MMFLEHFVMSFLAVEAFVMVAGGLVYGTLRLWMWADDCLRWLFDPDDIF